MSNTNCLENRQCPQCEQTERFKITATTVFELYDDGTGDHEDVEYDEESYARCPDCGWEGKWGDTNTENQAATTDTAPKQRFWVSWLQPTEDYRALTFPPNESIIGYWCSGYASGANDESIPILCAVVDAADQEAAAEAVKKDWPEWQEWRFIEERDADYKPGDRFPIDGCEWMQERFKTHDDG